MPTNLTPFGGAKAGLSGGEQHRKDHIFLGNWLKANLREH